MRNWIADLHFHAAWSPQEAAVAPNDLAGVPIYVFGKEQSMWKSSIRLLTRFPGLFRSLYLISGRGSPEKLLFLALIRKGDVVFDIGANRGHYSVLFSRLAGASGAVHAFEASPHTMALLQETLRSEGHPANLHVNNFAVGDQRQKVTLFMPGDDDGQASLTKHDAGSWEQKGPVRQFECEMIRLDDYVRDGAINRLDVVKLDIEGAEMLALRGFAVELKRLRPVISFELCLGWMKDFGYGVADLEQILRSVGYDEFYFLQRGSRPLVKVSDLQTAASHGFSVDVLCADSTKHRDRLAKLVAANG